MEMTKVPKQNSSTREATYQLKAFSATCYVMTE